MVLDKFLIIRPQIGSLLWPGFVLRGDQTLWSKKVIVLIEGCSVEAKRYLTQTTTQKGEEVGTVDLSLRLMTLEH